MILYPKCICLNISTFTKKYNNKKYVKNLLKNKKCQMKVSNQLNYTHLQTTHRKYVLTRYLISKTTKAV